jgi:GT2 family glycosyltransferase
VAQQAGARILQLPARKGPAYARNRGAELARGDILLFVDADVALAPDATAQVLATFAAEPQVAAVFGSYDAAPAEPNFLSRYKNLLHHWVHQNGREEASTFWAGCGAVRRDIFSQLGGFDESYDRPSIEDIELGARLRRAGHAIRLRKSLQGTHLKRWTVASLLTADIRDRALPWAALLLRDGLVNDLNLRWSNRLSAAAAQGMLATLLAGWWWPSLWMLTGALAVALLILDAPLYSFFRRQGGVAFAAGCVFWHWLYYLYSGATFAVVFLSRLRNGDARAPRKEMVKLS